MKSKILIITIIIVSSILALYQSKDNTDSLRVEDYMPKEDIIKVFSGGYENSGMMHVIEKKDESTYQINQMDFGTYVVFIYQMEEQSIKQTYTSETGTFDKNFLEEKSNSQKFILKEPLVKGTAWQDEYGSKYEITDVNIKVLTPHGEYECIEVTSKINDFESKKYYAKDIGFIKSVSDYHTTELVNVESTENVDLKDSENVNKLYEKYLR